MSIFVNDFIGPCPDAVYPSVGVHFSQATLMVPQKMWL